MFVFTTTATKAHKGRLHTCPGGRSGIGHNLERVALDPKHPRRLASEAELLALRPELSQIE
jgi:hypothetical protein